MLQSQQISPKQLAACRKQLEQRWKSRKVDETLLKHAWKAVYEVASLLYDEFCATKVAVFGSLAEPISFKKSSDIDMAVWGLSDNEHTKANSKVIDLRTGFKIDLINFDLTKGVFKERIQQKAIPIKKGEKPGLWKSRYHHGEHQLFPIVDEEIYEMYRRKLTERINDECIKIESTVDAIVKGLEDIETAPNIYKDYIEEAIVNKLADVYSGIERIFERIASEVDGYTPRGNRWHKDLLEQMTEQRPERSPVISQDIFHLLSQLLEYRHKVNKLYADELLYENTEEHAKSIRNLFQSFLNDLKMFTESLVYED